MLAFTMACGLFWSPTWGAASAAASIVFLALGAIARPTAGYPQKSKGPRDLGRRNTVSSVGRNVASGARCQASGKVNAIKFFEPRPAVN